MAAQILYKDGRIRPILRVFIYVLAVAVAQIVLWVPTGVVIGLVLGHDASNYRPPWWLGETIGFVAAVGVAFFLRVYLDRRSVESLGLSTRAPWARLFAIAVAIGAGMQLLIFAIEVLSGYSHDVSIASWHLAIGPLAGFGIVFLIAALTEEMALRGYILQNLWEEIGFWPAALLTSILFAVLHVNNPHFGEHRWLALANIALDGVFMCVAVLWTKSLWFSWGAHFAWNLFEGPVLGTPVSGINTGASIVVQHVDGSTIMTGGTFGPEAGVLALIAEAAGVAVLYVLYRAGAFERVPDTRETYARAPALKSAGLH